LRHLRRSWRLRRLRRHRQPLHHQRWTQAIPQYELGHEFVAEAATNIESALPGLYLTGQWRAGVALGDAQRPDHSLALNTHMAPGAFDELALTREQALDYLRRESIAIPGDRHGLVRLTYAGLGLGFGKAVRGRLNNHYPQEWRIRMR
jgi:NOL1/NOP2/fmu family ribosome biogenesis protein